MKMFSCHLLVAITVLGVSRSMAASTASQAAQSVPAAGNNGANGGNGAPTVTSSSSSSGSSSPSSSTPSQVANKRGDTDFAAAASQQQPVYSPNLSQQSSSSHQQNSGPSDYQSSASNSNLYYYYYPANQQSSGKTESSGSSDPYQASAASSYPSYSSDGSSPQHSSYDGGDASSFSGSPYQGHLHSAYAAAAAAAQQSHSRSPSFSQYSPSLAEASSQVNSQYASASGTPVTGYQGQASYGSGQGVYPASSNFQQTYAAPTESKSRFYGLGSVIMPLVGLGALAFLLPSVTNLGGKKKTKRSVDAMEPPKGANGVAEYAERLEKYFKIYRAAVESDDCMNRIVCEIGDSVSTVRGKAALLALFEKVAPQWMSGKMGVFKFGALNDKNAKCVRYKC